VQKHFYGVCFVALASCSGAPSDTGVAVSNLGTVYQVGPGKQYTSLAQVASVLKAGDRVEVQGGVTYGSVSFDKPGTAAAKITISGVKVNGKRPLISGGTNTVEMAGNHYVLEGFEITGGSSRCIFHHAHDITVRDVVVHDCPAQGLLGADEDSGSLTLEYSEFYRNGEGDRKHQIYMSTDQYAYPGSVFRMQHCYVHDGNGGNNIKSRAERNEIYYNWVEGALYHELELIGSEAADADVVREDSDVVGNVFRKITDFSVTRFGGDGTADTNGRYRFVNNTVITAGSGGVFRLFDGIQSLEMHNNVFVRAGGGAVTLVRDADATWTDGKQVIGGSKNWVPSGTVTPAGWTQTLQGSDPGLTNVGGGQAWPTAASALLGAGNAAPLSPAGYPFTNPLPLPLEQPPRKAHEVPGTAIKRQNGAAPDIGAFASAANSGPGPTPTPDAGTTPNPTADGGSNPNPNPNADGGTSPNPSTDAGSNPTPDPSADGGTPEPPPPPPGGCGTRGVGAASASAAEPGNPPRNVLDGRLATRWSAEGLGVTLTLDLGENAKVCGVDLAWYRGNARTSVFSLSVSSDGYTFNTVYSGESSGASKQLESYRFAAATARYVRVTGQGNSENAWNSITEAKVRATL
jgi:hypothetical protein